MSKNMASEFNSGNPFGQRARTGKNEQREVITTSAAMRVTTLEI